VEEAIETEEVVVVKIEDEVAVLEEIVEVETKEDSKKDELVRMRIDQNLKEKAVEEVKSPSIVAQEENVAEEVKNSLK
jgi:hypothetical protein